MDEQELRDAILVLSKITRQALDRAQNHELADGLARLGARLPPLVAALAGNQRDLVRDLRDDIQEGPLAFQLLGAVEVSGALAKALKLINQWLGEGLSALN
jgi:hypothetical protein